MNQATSRCPCAPLILPGAASGLPSAGAAWPSFRSSADRLQPAPSDTKRTGKTV